MAVRPGAVGRRALGSGATVFLLGETVGELLRGDEAFDSHVADRGARVLQVALALAVPFARARIRSAREGSEQLGGLVEQRDVADGERSGAFAMQKGALGCRPACGQLGQPGRASKEVLDELLGRERKPCCVEEHADVVRRADVLPEGCHVVVVDRRPVGTELCHEQRGEFAEGVLDEGDARDVVRLSAPLGSSDRARNQLRLHLELRPVDIDELRAVRHALA